MGTIWVGNIPRRDPGGDIGRSFGAGVTKGMGDFQKEQDSVLAVTIKMYQDATPEDRKLLEASPGWGRVLSMAEQKGIPVVQTPTGGRGFTTPVPSLEHQEAEQAFSFPGQEAAPGQTPLPSGVAGYTARKEALKSAVSGDLRLKSAYAGFYEKETNLADRKMALEEQKAADEALVKRGQLTEEQARTRLQERETKTREDEAKSQGLYREGTLRQQQNELRETIRRNNMHYDNLARELASKETENTKQQLGQYDNFNKRFSQYKTDLRQPLKMAERDQTVRQAFSDYMSYKNTVDPKNPIQVSGLQGATGEMMALLVDEVVRGAEPSSKLDEQRILNYLDTITAAASQGLLEPSILRNIGLTLQAAGYKQDVKSGEWKLPKPTGGWFSGGGTP